MTHIERLVAAINLPIGRWDRGARLRFCNDHDLAWADQPREQLLGRSLQELFGENAWAAAAPAFLQAFTARTLTYQRRLEHGTAAGRWIRIQVFPDADASGAVQAVSTIATDVHDDMLARDALLTSQTRLDRSARASATRSRPATRTTRSTCCSSPTTRCMPPSATAGIARCTVRFCRSKRPVDQVAPDRRVRRSGRDASASRLRRRAVPEPSSCRSRRVAIARAMQAWVP